MTPAEVGELVHEVILEASGQRPQLGPRDDLIGSGHLDSLALMQLIVRLQSALGVDLDISDVTEENFGTIEAIARFIERQAA